MNTFLAIYQSGAFKDYYVAEYKANLADNGIIAVIRHRGVIERLICNDQPHVDNCGRRLPRTAKQLGGMWAEAIRVKKYC